MHATHRRFLAAPASRLLETLRVDERARSTYKDLLPVVSPVVAESDMRHILYRLTREDFGSRPLTLIGRDLAMLQLAGAPESAGRAIAGFVDDLVSELWCGKAHRSLGEVILDEGRLEAEENRATDELLVLGETPERLRAAAEAARREAAVERERARLLDRRARELDREREREQATASPSTARAVAPTPVARPARAARLGARFASATA